MASRSSHPLRVPPSGSILTAIPGCAVHVRPEEIRPIGEYVNHAIDDDSALFEANKVDDKVCLLLS